MKSMSHSSFDHVARALRSCIITPRDISIPATGQNRREDSRRLASLLAKRHLRVRPELLPTVEKAVQTACDNLGLDRGQVLAYVSPEVGRNAQCLSGHDRPVLIFGSELVSLLNEAELCSVVGHELGHYLLPELNVDSEDESMEARIRSRYAELTMDRVGLIACRDRLAALGSELKIHSGLTTPHLRIDIAAAQHETREMLDANTEKLWREEAFSTHPPMPLRIRALERFALSDLYLKFIGGTGGTPIALTNQYIQSELEASIDHSSNDEMKRHLLMLKAWVYCLCRIDGIAVNVSKLNAVGPKTDDGQLSQAWASLQHFNDPERKKHASIRLRASFEKAKDASPGMTDSTVRHLLEHDEFTEALRHLCYES
jgi:hypothetical protein